MLTSCIDDDYQNIVKQGDPVIEASAPGKTEMGHTLKFNVKCSDRKGTALSTLKAELLFSEESVASQTIRTKEAGDYEVSLDVPFAQYIPNGDAIVRLTLQNVTTSTTVAEVVAPVERPHFNNLMFVAASGEKVMMTEGDDYNYTAPFTTAEKAFKGHFETEDGAWVFGWSGAEVDEGQKGDINFNTESVGNVTVTFNTCDYTFGPNEQSEVKNLVFSESDNVVEATLRQGQLCEFTGIKDDWFYDPDFFIDNEDGTYTFKAVDGMYTFKAVYAQNGFRIHAGTAGEPAKLAADGTGAVWIIGDAVYGKPTFADAQSWWTDTDHALCMAPVGEKTHQVTLTVGKQLKAGNSTNFKFFGQAGWGTEFGGVGSSNYLTCDDNVFYVGEGDGNIHLKDGAELVEGDTYVFTIDLTDGVAPGKLIITKDNSAAMKTLTLEDKAPQTMDIKKGTKFQFDGVVAADWFVDYDFFQANNDGTYTFIAASGRYSIKAYSEYKYLQAYPATEEDKPASLQDDGTGAIWAIGSECINKPTLADANNKSWWTDPDWDQCLAPIGGKKYRITLTVGQQLAATGLNFKFFGQPNWGVEFKGKDNTHLLTCESDIIGVGTGDDGHDNGNLYLKDGAVLTDGDTYVFTIDLSAGIKNGVLTVEKK